MGLVIVDHSSGAGACACDHVASLFIPTVWRLAVSGRTKLFFIPFHLDCGDPRAPSKFVKHPSESTEALDLGLDNIPVSDTSTLQVPTI